MLLGGEQITEIVHGAFSVRDGRVQSGNAFFRFLDRPPKGCPFFPYACQQLLPESPDTALTRTTDQAASRLLDEVFKRGNEFSPITLRAAPFKLLKCAHFVDVIN